MAAPATLQDLEGAMNALRGEILSITAPHIAASVTTLRTEVAQSVTTALAELRSHSESISQRVSAAVEEKFQSAATGFSAEQTRLNDLMHTEHDRLTQAHAREAQERP